MYPSRRLIESMACCGLSISVLPRSSTVIFGLSAISENISANTSLARRAFFSLENCLWPISVKCAFLASSLTMYIGGVKSESLNAPDALPLCVANETKSDTSFAEGVFLDGPAPEDNPEDRLPASIASTSSASALTLARRASYSSSDSLMNLYRAGLRYPSGSDITSFIKSLLAVNLSICRL